MSNKMRVPLGIISEVTLKIDLFKKIGTLAIIPTKSSTGYVRNNFKDLDILSNISIQ